MGFEMKRSNARPCQKRGQAAAAFTNSSPSGSLSFAYANPPGFNRRFYRAFVLWVQDIGVEQPLF
jgi:hypothetical protein